MLCSFKYIPALLTLGWLGAWQLKADGTHAQAVTATVAAALPPGSGGGGSGLVPRRRPLHR